MLSIPQVIFIFFMYVFQLATRAYVFQTLTTRILSERWPSYYFSIIAIIFAVHALVIGLGTKKDGENDSKLLASTKIIAYDLDDDQAVSRFVFFRTKKFLALAEFWNNSATTHTHLNFSLFASRGQKRRYLRFYEKGKLRYISSI